MFTRTVQRLRRAVRSTTKPARLAINTWLAQQADAEIERMREARAAAIEHEQRQHVRKVELSIHRKHIEKGIA